MVQQVVHPPMRILCQAGRIRYHPHSGDMEGLAGPSHWRSRWRVDGRRAAGGRLELRGRPERDHQRASRWRQWTVRLDQNRGKALPWRKLQILHALAADRGPIRRLRPSADFRRRQRDLLPERLASGYGLRTAQPAQPDLRRRGTRQRFEERGPFPAHPRL